jgi:hypothetical protein
MKFKRNQFRWYRATIKVHLGAIGTEIEEGDEIEFDGLILKMGGDEVQYPQLKGAVKSGWLVPSEDEYAEYRPRAAGIKVRPTDPDAKHPVVKADAKKEEMVHPDVMITTVQAAVLAESGGKKIASTNPDADEYNPRTGASRQQGPVAFASDSDYDDAPEVRVPRPSRRGRARHNPADDPRHRPPPSESRDDIAAMVPDTASTDVLYPPPHASRSTVGELQDEEVEVRATPSPRLTGPQRSAGLPPAPPKGSVGISLDDDEDIVI